MPIYEYRCDTCGKAMSKFWRSLSSVDEKTLACPTCGSRKLGRLVSRVRVLRGGSSGNAEVGPAGDMDESLMREMENVDENDPRAMGRLMRKMAASAGEDLGEEFNEVVGRLEKGEDPERIEKDMGDVFGGEGMGGMDGMGGMSDEMMPPAPTAEAAASDAEPTEPKAKTASKRASRRASASSVTIHKKPRQKTQAKRSKAGR